MKIPCGLLDDMVTHYPEQHPTEEANLQTEDQREKKRKIDAEYRRRCKIKKEERRANLQNLREKNVQLERENESCRKENDSMVQKLQLKEVEIKNFKIEIFNSKKDISNQENLLETLSQNPVLQELMLGSNQLEVALLENERNILCQNANWDDWMSEREQLLDEIEKLRHRNAMLKMQNQVLGDKILNQKDHGSKHKKVPISVLQKGLFCGNLFQKGRQAADTVARG